MDFFIGEILKEVFCITGYPSVKSKQKELLNFLKIVQKLDIDIIYASHYPWCTKKIYDICRFVVIDKENPILGFNTPKKYDRLCDAKDHAQVFTNYDVLPSATYAHYLLINLGTTIAKQFNYDVCYHIVYDLIEFFNLDNLDNCFYPMQNNISGNDAVVYPQKLSGLDTNVINSNIFALNMKSKSVETFFTKHNDLDSWSTLHDKWVPILKRDLNVRGFPCAFFELILTLELNWNNYQVKLISEELPKSSSGFFEALIADEKKIKLQQEGSPYTHDIEDYRKKLNVVRT